MRRSSTNICEISFPALSENEAFARMAVSAFVMPGNPTLEELSDIKTAISEAVTNAILHGYNQDGMGTVHMRLEREEDNFTFVVRDDGIGIDNVERAMEPLYTSRPELERSGMGFSFMEAFMDSLKVESEPGKGTTVTMTKSLGMSADASICGE